MIVAGNEMTQKQIDKIDEIARAARREYDKAYRLRRGPELREYQRQYRAENAEKIRQYQREYRQQHPETVAKWNREYWARRKAKLEKQGDAEQNGAR